jgi:hypothetical protein
MFQILCKASSVLSASILGRAPFTNFSANESLHVATLTLLAQHMYDCYLVGATKRMHQEKKKLKEFLKKNAAQSLDIRFNIQRISSENRYN